MLLKYALVKFVVIASFFLDVNSLCDNVKSVCDCQQTASNNRTNLQCPKMNVSGRYTHYIEIIDQHHININCVTFNPLNKIPKLYFGRANITRVDFLNCFNNDTRHTNYQFDFKQFVSKTLEAYDTEWNSIDVWFHDSGKVNETLFFSRWPLIKSNVIITNIYMQTSDSLPRLRGAEYLYLINTNLVDFNKFIGNDDTMQILEILNTKTITNLNKRNLSKFKNLVHLTIENSAIEDYFGQIFQQGSIFKENPGIEQISLISTFKDYPDKITLNATIFYYLNRLISLKLIDLKLEELPLKIFDDLEKLSHLVLRHNQLSRLSKNIFVNCQKLVKIDLAFNNFIRIDTTMFSALVTLAILNLSHNNLRSFVYDASNQTSFKGIYLDHNHIQMDSFTCPIINIQHSASVIDYSHNQISNSEPILDCIVKNPEVQDLKLKHNQIRSLRFLKMLSNQTLNKSYITLHLDNNLIDFIDLLEYQDTGANEDERTNIVLHLDSNPIFCDNCQYSNTLFVNDTGVILVNHDTVFQIPQPEFCIKSIFCSMNYFVNNYSCPYPCYCTFNKHFNSLAINCENATLKEIPFLNDELLYRINVKEIYLNLQNNNISNISFDNTKNGKQTSFDVIRRITKINLEHNSIDLLKFHDNHFPIALKTLLLAWNKISNIDETTLVLLNTRESLLALSLGNNTVTRNHQLYDRYINRIKFLIIDQEAIDEEFNHLKLEAHIRDGESSIVSIVVVIVVFILMMIGLSYISYVFQRSHTKVLVQKNEIEQSQTDLVSEQLDETCNEIL